MPGVHGISVYLGHSPAAKHAAPAANLLLDDDGAMCQQFHRLLLDHAERQGPMEATVNIPELPPVDVRWTGVGRTAGVALWVRGGSVGAASVLLNGLENGEELATLHSVLCQAVPVPLHVWDDFVREPRRPLLATVYLDLYHMMDPVIATAAPALANSFFTMFGTSG